jgi:hypothetical protein
MNILSYFNALQPSEPKTRLGADSQPTPPNLRQSPVCTPIDSEPANSIKK